MVKLSKKALESVKTYITCPCGNKALLNTGLCKKCSSNNINLSKLIEEIKWFIRFNFYKYFIKRGIIYVKQGDSLSDAYNRIAKGGYIILTGDNYSSGLEIKKSFHLIGIKK